MSDQTGDIGRDLSDRDQNESSTYLKLTVGQRKRNNRLPAEHRASTKTLKRKETVVVEGGNCVAGGCRTADME